MKLKKWEIALFAAVIIAVLWGINAEGQQEMLSEKLIRLHVVADSDDERDQEVKLLVRDAVTEKLGAMLSGVTARDEAYNIIDSNLCAISETANSVLSGVSPGDQASVTLTQESFPTRYYDTFTLPAGKYTSLKVVIGEGRGRNWWCVVFPPLCTAAASDLPAAESFSEDEIRLITDGGGSTVIKFRTLEIIAKIREWIDP
ncbi:MAG: stage II sporulation protein R [Oscillospiraceae bacterium]|nr:stage II sporulation protein R [Oscillospiraceae bacterium]